MKKGNQQKSYLISELLNELPTVGTIYREKKVKKVKKLYFNNYDPDTYKINTVGKSGKKYHYFVRVLQPKPAIFYGNIANSDSFL